MIEIKGLKVAYGEKTVLDDLNLSLPHGIHGIVGLNGSGKTTLLNTIYGIVRQQSGDIYFEGEKISKRQVAFLETNNFFYSRMTGLEYLKLFKSQNKDFDIRKWNKIFELPLDTMVETYSTGMKKKIALLGILSLNRPVIILDEPFNGLDLESIQNIKHIIEILSLKGSTIIITSHILESLTSQCDKIHFLNNKKIEFSMEKKDFENLEEKIFSNIESHNRQLIKELLKSES